MYRVKDEILSPTMNNFHNYASNYSIESNSNGNATNNNNISQSTTSYSNHSLQNLEDGTYRNDASISTLGTMYIYLLTCCDNFHMTL